MVDRSIAAGVAMGLVGIGLEVGRSIRFDCSCPLDSIGLGLERGRRLEDSRDRRRVPGPDIEAGVQMVGCICRPSWK